MGILLAIMFTLRENNSTKGQVLLLIPSCNSCRTCAILSQSETERRLVEKIPIPSKLPLRQLRRLAQAPVIAVPTITLSTPTARNFLIRAHMPRNSLASMNIGLLRAESGTTFLRKLRKHLPKQSSTSIIFEQRVANGG